MVILVSMLKDFVENCKRTNSDNQENNSDVLVYESENFVIRPWHSVRTGDIIKVPRGQFFPADILLLYCASEKSECYIETKNLDGETNLKQKVVPDKVKNLVKDEYDVQQLVGSTFECEGANPYLYTFTGVLTTSSESMPIEPKNFILRGCNLRTSNFIIGVVAFTGQYTKIMMNSVKTKPKKSDLESKMGLMILMIFIGLVLFCTVASLIYIIAYKEFKDQIPYLKLGTLNLFNEFVTRLGNWILIFGNFVPISLMVTTEGVRFFQAMVITKDEKLFAHKVGSYTDVQSSNLNEELGQISYVFSDKTGTLTCNEMIFKKLIVAGIPYGNESQGQLDSARTMSATKVSNVDFTDNGFLSDLSNPKKV